MSYAKQYLLELISPSSDSPVWFDEAMDHLRVTSDKETAAVSSALRSAIDYFDGPKGVLGRPLCPQQWKIRLPSFSFLNIPLFPIISIDSIEYFDQGDAKQTADPNDFYVVSSDDVGYLKAKNTFIFPSLSSTDYPVEITFTCGYAVVPNDICEGIKLMLTHFYENRGAVIVGTGSVELPLGVERITNKYRIGWSA